MIISEVRDTYYGATTAVSQIVRQVSLSGVAIIWFFKSGKDSGIAFNETMREALWLFVLALALDLLQYVYKSAAWGTANWVLWRRYKDNDRKVEMSGIINWPALLLFWGKAAACIYASFQLLSQLYNAIKP